MSVNPELILIIRFLLFFTIYLAMFHLDTHTCEIRLYNGLEWIKF